MLQALTVSLLDDLRKAAPSLPPSHKATVSEVIDLLSAWLAYAEHGVGFLKAAEEGGQDAVAKLLADSQHPPPVEAPSEQGAAETDTPPEAAQEPAASSGPTAAELEAQIAALTAQLAAARGVADLTPAEVTSG